MLPQQHSLALILIHEDWINLYLHLWFWGIGPDFRLTSADTVEEPVSSLACQAAKIPYQAKLNQCPCSYRWHEVLDS
jgi:hypothetical protein